MERLWLIRTRHNKILGPVALKKIAELLGKGSLGPYDEICSGNGYWIRVREEELVQKYVQQGAEQVFNPLNPAKLHANLLNFIDEVISGKRPVRENTLTNIQTNTDISMVGKNLPKIDPATVNNATTPTSAAGVGAMPDADDLAYPSMDDIAQIDASVDPAKVAAADPGKAKSVPANPIAAADTGGGKLPSADDLDFPDVGGSDAASSAPLPSGDDEQTAAADEDEEKDDTPKVAADDDDEKDADEDEDEEGNAQRSFADLPVAPGTTAKSSDSQTGILTRAHFDLRKLQKAQAEEEQAEMEASAASGASDEARPQCTSLPDMEDFDEEEEAVQQEFEKSSVIRVTSLGKQQRAQNFRSHLGLIMVIVIIIGVFLAVGPLMKRVSQYKKKLKPAAQVSTEVEQGAGKVAPQENASHPTTAPTAAKDSGQTTKDAAAEEAAAVSED
ncbi:MAG: hypothetical protein J6Y94_04925 [Bacteriovoracaceae bacterium]|nr:hypothetical protein [Bacteriovoracaceae bacterium]